MNNELFTIDVKQTGKQVELRWVPVAELSSHPKNPRIGRPDKVDSIVGSMLNDGYRPEKPMLVRPYETGYQIIGGHSRHIAAQEAGIDRVFCAIEAMDDDEAILRMGSDNINDPFPWFSVCLYVVQNSVKDSKKGLSRTQLIRAATGKDGGAAEIEAKRRGDAGEVLQFLMEKSYHMERLLDPDTNLTRTLAEIHAAQEWLWSALVDALLDGSWTVQTTRDKVGALKDVAEPPKWADWSRVGEAVISGQMRINEVAKLQRLVDSAKVSGEFRSHLQTAIEDQAPSLVSEVQAIIAYWEDQQANAEKIERDAKLVRQRQAEESRQFILNMRKSISLDDWGKLSQSERDEILVPAPGEGGSFNKQESKDIEWAQWSWNPVTGCKHSCSYCLSGDTLILLADGSSVALKDLIVGEKIIGTQSVNGYRKFVETEVLAHWRSTKQAFEITLADGRKIISSGDHRFLTESGWKFVTPVEKPDQRPFLTTNNSLLGIGEIDLRVVSIIPLGVEVEMFDITTGTEDFIANGVVAHNCYARDIALSARMKNVYPNGFEPTFRSNALNAPKNTKVPPIAATDARYKNVFTCSMADLFGRWVPKEWIDAVMMSVKGNPQWDFLFLTKFPQRLAEIEIPENAWMGTTVDLQARVANAEKAFAKVQCRVKWLSIEPLIEPLQFSSLEMFDWVVIGGASPSEKTPKWEPPYRWIDSLVRRCDDAKVPIYMKSNLGIANRILELPLGLPLQQDLQQAPPEFHYLGSPK